VWDAIRRTFHYAFDGRPRKGGGIPKVEVHEIHGPLTLGGVHVVPVPLLHGEAPILGFRFGDFAYLTDCSAIPDASWPLLEGVRTLAIDALRHRAHSTHFTVAQALEAVARVAPARAWLTHMNHELGHAATNAQLPAGVELAYDGLVLDVEVDGS
jgi:phosphoribosyl 1,2-cyclic phosphate phosphodiesterase